MLYVSLLRAKRALSFEALSRRAQWHPPNDVRIIAEYWLSSRNPTVIVICEANSESTVIAANTDWSDLFDVTVVRATTAEHGLEFRKL